MTPPTAPSPSAAPDDATRPLRVVLLGSTGSIGRSALEVLAHDAGNRLQPFALVANRDWRGLARQAREHLPHHVALNDAEFAEPLRDALADLHPRVRVHAGPDAVEALVRHPETDRVLSAFVGAAGLRATWAALDAAKPVALANKESLVVAGALMIELARARGVPILPVDSEHSAIFQALRAGRPAEVRRLVLTSSGGPFRGKTRDQLREVTPEQALRHPTWAMGPKITIDSATLMNKALEVVEARWLFEIDPERIEVVVHPESVVHSLVEFVDGSVIAQMSPPDMKLPIQYALTHPDRVPGPSPRLDFARPFELRFQPPDLEAFPALELGFQAVRRGGSAPAVLNAANEVAVQRFLDRDIRFLDIPALLRSVLDHHTFESNPGLDDLLRLDARARREAERWTA